jgi:hypothetical protein
VRSAPTAHGLRSGSEIFAINEENPVYGTSRVLTAFNQADERLIAQFADDVQLP